MKTNVDKLWLIEKLESNRGKHRAVFLKAHEAFRKKAIAEFEQKIREARENVKFKAYVHLTEPTDHTKDYDRVIAMVQANVDTFVNLDEKDYAKFVQDVWEWTEQWKGTSNAYGVDPDAE